MGENVCEVAVCEGVGVLEEGGKSSQYLLVQLSLISNFGASGGIAVGCDGFF